MIVSSATVGCVSAICASFAVFSTRRSLMTSALTVALLATSIASAQQSGRQRSSKSSSSTRSTLMPTSPSPVIPRRSTSTTSRTPSGTAGGVSSGSGQRELRYVVQEEMAIGTIVADIVDDAGLEERYGAELVQSPRSPLRFQFLSAPTRLPVAVDDITGVVRTTGKLDRETICGWDGNRPGSGFGGPGGPGGPGPGAVVPSAIGDMCVIRLDVVVTPMNYFHIIKTSLEILDINDNDPQFPNSTVNLEVIESSSVGSAFNIPSAYDRDTLQFGVQRYELRDVATTGSGLAAASSGVNSRCHSAASHFELKVQRKLDGSTDVRLVLTQALDREKCAEHRMTVVAIDGGEPARTGTCVVIVTVADANDNEPTFQHSSYEVTITENLAIGTTVAVVTAQDPDVGPNAVIEYQLSPSSLDSHVARNFAVDPLSGSITVIGRVDRETSSTYRLLVTARNTASTALPSVARESQQDQSGTAGVGNSFEGGGQQPGPDTVIIIHVEDQNDNPPTIAINTLLTSSGDVALVPEAQDPGTFVGHVIVRDPDAGRNGRFDCLLAGDGAGDWFRLISVGYDDAGEFQIVTGARLDREVKDSYLLQLTCKDGGLPPLVSFAQLRVQVTDVNDHRPLFERELYTVELLENNYIGAVLLQLKATDKDLGQNAELVYSLVTSSSSPDNDGDDNADTDRETGPFDVDHSSGVIRLKQSVDRETKDQYRFKVKVTDLGGAAGGLTSTADVHVTVTDVNDEPPRFLSPVYSVGLDENVAAGTEVTVLQARDYDAPPNDQFTYHIVPDGGLSEAFQLDQKTGRLTTTMQLDREEHDVYNLLVVVRDIHAPLLSSTARVTVYVTDDNDHEPVWIVPPEQNTTIVISGRAPKGLIVARVRATDADLGDNARLTYSLLNFHEAETGETSLPFDVDPEAGSIRVTRNLTQFVRLHENATFDLILLASDNGQPSRRTSEVRRLAIVVSRRPDASTSPGYLSSLGNGRGGTEKVIGLFSDGAFVAAAIAAGAGLAVLIAVLGATWCVIRRRKRNKSRKSAENGDRVYVAYGRKYNCRVEESLKLKNDSNERQRPPDTATLVGKPSNVSCNGQIPETTALLSPDYSKPDILDGFGESEKVSPPPLPETDFCDSDCYLKTRLNHGCMTLTSSRTETNDLETAFTTPFRSNNFHCNVTRIHLTDPPGYCFQETHSTTSSMTNSLQRAPPTMSASRCCQYRPLPQLDGSIDCVHGTSRRCTTPIPVIDIRPTSDRCGGVKSCVQLPPQMHPTAFNNREEHAA